MALAGVRGMAQATNGQTKAGTAGKKTERVLVHRKGGQPEDQVDRRWMDGIPSKASGSGVTAKQARIRMQVGIAEMRREAKR